MRFIFLIFALLLLPFLASGNVVINEVMYDLEGSDSGREWVEIFNNSNEQIDISGWKFYESETNHKINTINEEDDFIIPSNSYAVIADKPEKFLADWSGFSGIIFDSSFSLSNNGEIIILRDNELDDINTVDYLSDWGADGDGKSLQKINGEWAAADPTPGARNSDQENQEQNDENPDQEQTAAAVVWPVEPQIYVDARLVGGQAGEDEAAVAGADVVFEGRALGIKKEPLENAEYLWSFGDGATARGKTVRHFYKYPSEYIVILTVSSGMYSTSDRLTIKVLPNQIKIIEANNDFIKIHNGSSQIIDISGWLLRTSNKTFKFPKTTLIKNGAELPIPASISGIEKNIGQSVELLYPNYSIADSYLGYRIAKEINSEKNTVSKTAPAKIRPKQDAQGENKENIKQTIEYSGSALDNAAQTQTANIITAAPNKVWGIKEWLMLVLGLGIFGGIGFVFARRFNILRDA